VAWTQWATLDASRVVVSIDVVSNKCAGVRVVNNSSRAWTIDVKGPGGVPRITGLSCPAGVTTTQAIVTAQRFDWSTATADWTASVT
jgi:hypothetical protein